MEIDFTFICDYAQSGPKLNALGIGIDTIYAPKLPARHPHLSIVAQFRFSITEVGSKKLTIFVIDADGQNIVPPIAGNIEVKPSPAGLLESTARIVMEIGNIEFKQYGPYSVRLSLDGREVANIPLRVIEPPQVNNPPL